MKLSRSTVQLSLYWKLQLLGWSLASLYWAYGAYIIQKYSVFSTIGNVVLDVLIGISLTHTYRLYVKRNNQKLFVNGNFFKPLISVLILAVFFMLINNVKWYFFWHMVKGNTVNFWESLLYWDPPLITGLRLMCIWVLGYHFYTYHKDQISKISDNAELSILTKQVQLDNLFSQLNPHFLFNSLNSIKSLVSENPIKARRSIDLLSDLLRTSIYSRERLISIADELQLVKDYIELEKNRFEERLKLETNIDVTLLTIKIPSLSIQTLVENAVKHGIQKTTQEGVIKLFVLEANDFIEIKVENSGMLKREINKDNGLGIKNLMKIIEIQYAKKATFELSETSEGTVIATLLIPLQFTK